MNKEKFIETCQTYDIALTDKQLQQFEQYIHLLQEWNEKMNLTSITDEEEIWEKHFLDSIAPFSNLSFTTMCDVGSGAGFPGVPLKIAYPNIDVTLVEPSQKRCRFLQEVNEQLGLGLHIENARAEDFVKEHREAYDVVSARAVARLTILLELCIPLLKVDGTFVALKGKSGHEEVLNAKFASEVLHVVLDSEKEVQIEEAIHVNFYFKKTKSTSKKYPRAYAQIKKKPLGE